MTLQELQNFDFKALDPKAMGSWPWVVRGVVLVALFIALLVAGYFLMIQDTQAGLERVVAEEKALRADFSEKAHKATNLAAYKAQLEQMDRQFGELLRQLPGRTEIENLIEEVARESLSSNLTQELFKPEGEQVKEFYAELPITMKLSGDYHEFAEFASRVSALPRIVTMHDVKIVYDEKTKGGPTGLLTMDVIAKTYRYLEPDEIAAQQEAARAASAAKGKKGRAPAKPAAKG
jgi:type IV pilus assembly protein PilO